MSFVAVAALVVAGFFGSVDGFQPTLRPFAASVSARTDVRCAVPILRRNVAGERRTDNPIILRSATEDAVGEVDYETPEDAVVTIKPTAMTRLRELKEQQKTDSLVLRMGVRNGGCSGLSYVMDFAAEEDINDDDVVDTYPSEGIKCVVDSKSMLYLYGLELDYSTELIGGGFKFFNPNAEESCGCGSSFAV